MNPMANALKDRKAKGVDITISISPQEMDEEQKKLGLAPAGESHPNPEQDSKDALLGQLGHQDEGEPDMPSQEPLSNPDEDADKMLIRNELKSLGRGSMAVKAMNKMKDKNG